MFVTSERNAKLIQTAAYRLFLCADGGHAVDIMIDVTQRTRRTKEIMRLFERMARTELAIRL